MTSSSVTSCPPKVYLSGMVAHLEFWNNCWSVFIFIVIISLWHWQRILRNILPESVWWGELRWGWSANIWCLSQSWDPLIMRGGARMVGRQRSLSVVLWWWPSQHWALDWSADGNNLIYRGATQSPHNSSSWQFCVIINCLLSWDPCDISNWQYIASVHLSQCFLGPAQLGNEVFLW